MKKILLTICAATLLMTGCGGGEQTSANTSSGATVKLATIAPLNTDEEKMDGIFGKLESALGIKEKHHLPKFFNNLKTMQMAIDAGTVDQISLYKCVANYLIAATNDKYEVVANNALEKISYSFCFAVRKDDAQLKADLDKIIDDMKSDGTLDKLVDEYINNVKADNILKVNIPKIDGTNTLKIGVTGDLPPLDLILPDNSPAGFNTAMLVEVSKRLNKNIELVQIESGARAAALGSKLIDVAFWAVVPFGNSDIPADIDKPEGIDLSKPYFKDNLAHIKLKNTK